jgi:hypothetical protein
MHLIGLQHTGKQYLSYSLSECQLHGQTVFVKQTFADIIMFLWNVLHDNTTDIAINMT